MKIKTKFFGEIDIAEEQIILFPFGLYGFEEYNRFVLLHDEEDEGGIFRWLQCVDEEGLCFTVMEPGIVCENYSPKLPENSLKKIGADDETDTDNADNNENNKNEDLIYLVITVVYEEIEKSTVNLLSPIAINSKNRVAAQIILESYEPQNSGYKTKHLIFGADANDPAAAQEGDVGICLS